MQSFFAELKRRHIYRVSAAYAVVAWILLQIINNIAPVLELPPWVARAFLVALVAGFPIALIFAWIRELEPADGRTARAATGKLDWVLIGALVVVIGLLSYQEFAPSSAIKGSETAEANVSSQRAAANSPATAISVAVLPFTNLSGDASQEFFSDGMTEEITAALAKIPDLRVVARTSAFEFKGQNRNIQTIGQQLQATHLIEGSVRKAGQRLRITAQLINARDGTHMWSENYDRELTDIFAIQEDIARAIATSLRMPLGLKPGDNLVSNRDIDSQSYEKYLRAKALYQARGYANLQSAIELLRAVVALNPSYAPAWALMARAYTTRVNYSPAILAQNPRTVDLIPEVQSSRQNAEPAARKSVELDPNSAQGYSALAFVDERAGRPILAEEYYLKALALDPNDPETLLSYSNHLSNMGRIKDALPLIRRANELEPFVPILRRDYALIQWLDGDDDAALATFRSLASAQQNRLSLEDTVLRIVQLQAGAGRFKEAAETLETSGLGEQFQNAAKEATRLLRVAPSKVALPNPPLALGVFDFVYLFVGAPEQVLTYYERLFEAGWMSNARTRVIWHASYAPVRNTERFKTAMRKAGYVDYWRVKGWPDLCHPTTGDDFVCD